MRELELSLILVNLIVIVWGAAAQRPTRLSRVAFPALLIVAGIFQVTIEGYRWQMLPAYFSLLVTATLSARRDAKIGWVGLAGVVAALVMSSLATVVYPVFELPRPSGHYTIGTVSYHLIDKERTEVFGAKPGGPRELMIQLWYPGVARPSDRPERYRGPEVTMAKFAYFKFVKTHTFRNIPVANSSAAFPIILFSPSWHGLRDQEMTIVEDLVSHGFVVVGVDHPYGSGVVVFPDGRKIWARAVNFMDTSSEATTRKSLLTADQEVRIRASDLVFVVSQLKQINQNDTLGRLTGRLDLARVGVFGYSFGGAVAVEACWLDSQLRSALDLDGALFGESAKVGIAQPFLMMTDSAGPPSQVELASGRPSKRRWAQFLAEQSRMVDDDFRHHGGYLAEIAGIAHANFSDDSLVSPIRWLSGGGSIDPNRAIDIVRGMTLALFQSTLEGGEARLITEEAARFPEIRLKVYHASHERFESRSNSAMY